MSEVSRPGEKDGSRERARGIGCAVSESSG